MSTQSHTYRRPACADLPRIQHEQVESWSGVVAILITATAVGMLLGHVLNRWLEARDT